MHFSRGIGPRGGDGKTNKKPGCTTAHQAMAESNEKEVVIKISAKNLTSKEFDEARKGIAGLGNESEKTGVKGKGLKDSFKETFSVVAQGAGIALGAITTLAGGVVALGLRGSTVADVREQFETLNGAIGNSADA